MSIYSHEIIAPTSLETREHAGPAVSALLIAVVLGIIGLTSESGVTQILAGLAALVTVGLSVTAAVAALRAPAQERQG